MEITDVLNAKTIATHLDVHNKAEAIEAMAEMLLKADIINDKEAFIKDVYLREEVGPTGIGDSIAIPHGKSDAVVTPGVAIAVLDEEIAWESLDDTGAKVIILFAVGSDNAAAEDHLRLLAMFSKRLGDDAVLDKLMDADTVVDVMTAFIEDDSVADEDTDDEEELDLDEISIL